MSEPFVAHFPTKKQMRVTLLWVTLDSVILISAEGKQRSLRPKFQAVVGFTDASGCCMPALNSGPKRRVSRHLCRNTGLETPDYSGAGERCVTHLRYFCKTTARNADCWHFLCVTHLADERFSCNTNAAFAKILPCLRDYLCNTMEGGRWCVKSK